MTPKEKAISLFNNNMRLAIGCRDGEIVQPCSKKCGIGVCSIQIYEAKRISRAMCDEIQEQIGKYYHEVKVSGVIGIKGYFQKELEFWNEVKNQINLL